MNRQALIVIAIAALWTTSQVQRVELGALVGGSTMLADFGVTAAGAGLLLGIYFPLNGVVQIPAGMLADLASPRRVLVLASVAMALTTVALAAAPSVALALLARGVTGLTSGFLWLAALKVVTLLPTIEYSRGVSVLSSFGATGTVLGLSLIPVAASAWSWRGAMLASALPTIALALLIALLPVPAPPAPDRRPRPSYGAEARRRVAEVGQVLGKRENWVLWLPQIAWTGVMSSILSWLPRFGRDTLSLPPAMLGLLPALMPIALLVGNTTIGYSLARAQRRRRASIATGLNGETGEITYLRVFYTAAAAYVGVLALVVAVTLDAKGVAAVAIALGLLSGASFLAQAHMAALAAPSLLATATGVVNSLGFFAAFVFPWLMGVVMDAIDRPGSPDWRYSVAAYRGAFGAVALALGAALVLAWVLSHSRLARLSDRPAPAT